MNILLKQMEQNIKEIAIIKTPVQIAKMKEAGRICAEILNILGDHIKPGVTTLQIDQLAGNLMRQYDAEVDRTDVEGHEYAEFQNVFFSYNNVIARGMASNEP